MKHTNKMRIKQTVLILHKKFQIIHVQMMKIPNTPLYFGLFQKIITLLYC
jgi:hypothetical protein